MNKIISYRGLLWRGGEAIPLALADDIARQHGYVYAEHYVKALDVGWRWHDRKGVEHSPQNMETRHLFMTLVAVWNAKMPVEARIRHSGTWEHRVYRFPSSYTDTYLAEAIAYLAAELRYRRDIEPEWAATITRMMEWLARPHIQE